MFKNERNQHVNAPKTLDLKPPYSDKVAEKEFPVEYEVPRF